MQSAVLSRPMLEIVGGPVKLDTLGYRNSLLRRSAVMLVPFEVEYLDKISALNSFSRDGQMVIDGNTISEDLKQ